MLFHERYTIVFSPCSLLLLYVSLISDFWLLCILLLCKGRKSGHSIHLKQNVDKNYLALSIINWIMTSALSCLIWQLLLTCYMFQHVPFQDFIMFESLTHVSDLCECVLSFAYAFMGKMFWNFLEMFVKETLEAVQWRKIFCTACSCVRCISSINLLIPTLFPLLSSTKHTCKT